MYFVGIDVGSLTTDGVLLDEERNVLSQVVTPTGPDVAEAAHNALVGVLDRAHIPSSRVEGVVATGYGRNAVKFAAKTSTEVICHARGARHLTPHATLVIDIGGQDTKVIAVADDGCVADFVMNDKCAAGTGRFLEVMARALDVPLEEMGRRGLDAPRAAAINSTCTVFGESEVISLLSQGTPVGEIVAGLHNVVAGRIEGMLGTLRPRPGLNLLRSVVVCGGVALNRGVVRAIEKTLGVNVAVPQNPQTVGALGAALAASETYNTSGRGVAKGAE
ncbi:MAG: 2-hydroxyglutaryl-CoA dehydratase [Planctomycetota bacterium]|nr:MAG: 2-hydroxyglutaryl-CoA dehydratase [Planctomycetota bacterium]